MDPIAANCPEPLRVLHLIPMVHVASVPRALEFYALVGFSCGETHEDERGRTVWASAVCKATAHGGGKAAIMFAQADPNPEPGLQGVLFYMYSHDVAALREHLLRVGVADGGRYGVDQVNGGGGGEVFQITRPFYMPAGELRIHDPDGYCILVGQLK